MNSEYWLSDNRIGMKEAVFSKVYNKIEESSGEFKLTKIEEEMTKSFMVGLWA